MAEIVQNAAALIRHGEDRAAVLQDRKIHVVPLRSIPLSLRHIPDHPRWLFVQGDPAVLDAGPTVAVVGTRNATDLGRKATALVVKTLSAYPVVLVSGLAEGIDQAAHLAGVQAGLRNVAFLGHGINQIFPSATAPLREAIVDDGGAVVTEYLPEEHYQKAFFVERNRLQAGLANVVIPVEAAERSGTAHTVRFARSFNRQIIGIRWPGSNGLSQELEREQRLIIDIFTPRGRQELDRVIRALAEQAGHDTYALAKMEERILSEIEARDVRPSDIDHLIRSLRSTLRTDE